MPTREYVPTEVLQRITSLERNMQTLVQTSNATVELVTSTVATSTPQVTNKQQNFLRNGDFDHTRNTYLYDPDYSGAATVDADVSEEAAHWFAHIADTAVKSTGSMTATDATLTLDTASFVAGDAGKQIVVEGAGTAGADLVTTIASYTSTTEVELTNVAVTTVSTARVRWRLQTLMEDTTDDNIDADEATNTALKTTAHSRFGTVSINNPRFNKVDGWAEIGKGNTLDAPLPYKLCKPSKSYILSFIFRLKAKVTDGAITATDNTFTSATAQFTANDVGKTVVVTGAGAAGADLTTTIASYTSATEVELTDAAGTTVSNAETTFSISWDNSTAPRIYAGVWDNTAGKRKYISSSALTLTGTVIGTPAGTTSRDYLVVARTNWGRTLGTNVITVAGAPNDASFSQTCYVRLDWTRVSSAVAYDVYRKTGATYHLLQTVYPQNSYFDSNYTERTAGGYPTTDDSEEQAFLQTTQYNFSPTTDWQRIAMNVTVPSTYDIGATTDKQWLRIGLTDNLAGAGLQWGLQIDLISLDDGDGQYSRSPLDFFALRDVSLTASSGDQGTTGTGGGGEYIPSGGTDYCPTFETKIRVSVNGEPTVVTAIELFQLWENGEDVLVENRRGEYTKIRRMGLGSSRPCFTVGTVDGEQTTCSSTQPFFSDSTDTLGKPLKSLNIGDKLQTRRGESSVQFIIKQPRLKSVVKLELEGVEKGFWLDDIAGHNNKPEIV